MARETGAVLLSLIAAAMLGLGAPLAKYILNSVSPIALVFLALLIALAISYPLSRTKGQLMRWSGFSRKEKYAMVELSTIGTVLPLVLILYGVTMTSAIETAFFIQLQSVFGILFGRVLLKETMQKRRLMGVALVFLGSFMILLNDLNSFRNQGQANGLLGDLLVVLGAILLGFSYSLLKRLSSHMKPEHLVPYRSLLGLVVATPFFAFAMIFASSNSQSYRLVETMPVIALYACTNFSIGWLAMQKALTELPSWLVASLVQTMPFLGVLASMILLGEGLTLMHVLGGLVTFVGGFVASYAFKNAS